MPFRGYLAGLLSALVVGPIAAAAPTLSIADLAMSPGETGMVVVFGDIDGQSTFGVTIQVVIDSRPGNTGTVFFTPAPPVDIVQLDDPWPGLGTFTPFDADLTGSLTLNGSSDDNGEFVDHPVTFSGPLSGFPVQVGIDANGVWDVLLSSYAGDSSWGELATTLHHGTITVTGGQAIPTVSEWALIVLAFLLIGAGALVIAHRPGHAPVDTTAPQPRCENTSPLRCNSAQCYAQL